MIKIINDNGRIWVIKFDSEFVTFYDPHYEHTPLGQMVSRYYISSILTGQSGLCLDGNVPQWNISADGMLRIREYLLKEVDELLTAITSTPQY